jgi:ribonuclease-3
VRSKHPGPKLSAEERHELETVLGHHFAQVDRLERALTHRSHRQNAESVDNERLEFLGDRVLGLVVSQHLFQAFSDWEAGKLSKGLAQLVSTSSLCSAATRLQLGNHLRLGPGEEKTGGREKKRLLADVYEAIAGAIYLDAGLPAAASFLTRTLIDPMLLGAHDTLHRSDYKSSLQEWLQERALGTAEYRVHKESGPDHQKIFEVEVWHSGRRLASSEGRSKKEAEQSAAKTALQALELEQGVPS